MLTWAAVETDIQIDANIPISRRSSSVVIVVALRDLYRIRIVIVFFPVIVIVFLAITLVLFRNDGSSNSGGDAILEE